MNRSKPPSICPSCGARAMTPKRVAVATHAGRRRIIVPDVEAEECSACGERLYDLAALRKIRVARKSVRPRARRAA